MAVLHKFDYVFAIATIFTFLDAWNIGANDVANSFATSVSSRSLTLKQAMLVASVCEFAGSILVGDKVADTVRTKIVDPHHYDGSPQVLLLAMMCAIVGSSTFLTFATRYGMPVSTTHSIVGGLVGSATASIGIQKINWGISGVSQVFAAWVVAPGIAGVIGGLLFFFTKMTVLVKPTAVRRAFFSIPVFTFITVGAIAMLVAWKGAKLELAAHHIVMAVLIPAGGVVVLQAFFIMPYLWVRIFREDWTLRWYHCLQGPLLLKRPPPPPTPFGYVKPQIKDYYRGHLTPEELAYMRASETLLKSVQTPNDEPPNLDNDDDFILPLPALPTPPPTNPGRVSVGGSVRGSVRGTEDKFIPPRPMGPWNSWPVIGWRINRFLLRGIEKDVISMQKRNVVLKWDLEDMHARAERYDNRAEYMYSALQILTAAAASFTHGANDVANAIAPFTTAYEVWHSGTIPDLVQVPIWVLAFGGGAIVLGLLTFGYHVMRTLGNRLTLISPSRGFCMELASAVTVLMATRLSLPVSTTQCITGATVGVGLANGDWRCINPKLVGWIYLGWIITVPVTALISGSLMAFILKAPSW
ncbi:Phosphate-repressible phosphate permease-like protein [Hapsidospora chrysogenum ATCC 11550]|uniref:Phosphate transporter n=1 Tax=Hapsidospora chrysogenum (strain ATCC 11550 / CBS 779.69 / DSM 880 / IAM 14645 / JCM 23072 / IMI 49137) TaxID=857340 RepID=A0A086T0A6_HAPC1|nr:Phosphate-repressible phosphate permease-like protein [Hapsidospora chrysogenum ATCC 11550]